VALGLHTSVAPDNALTIFLCLLISSLRILLCALPVLIVELCTPDSGYDQFCCLPKRSIIAASRRRLSPLVIVVHQYMCMPVEVCLLCVPALHCIGTDSGIMTTERIKIRGVI
jgi:hypothetical protein